MKQRRIYDLKPIALEAVPQAIEKADRYRVLNDPQLAELICLQVLAVDPDNQHNLRTLILSISDQFANPGSRVSSLRALCYVTRLESEYERAYYRGLLAEREARASLGRTHRDAYGGFCEAMSWYEKADELSPSNNDDARLRYNTCARTLEHEELEPPTREPELPLE